MEFALKSIYSFSREVRLLNRPNSLQGRLLKFCVRCGFDLLIGIMADTSQAQDASLRNHDSLWVYSVPQLVAPDEPHCMTKVMI